MSMMSELIYFLGLQVKQLMHGTFLCQLKYCFAFLKKFKMEDCKWLRGWFGRFNF